MRVNHVFRKHPALLAFMLFIGMSGHAAATEADTNRANRGFLSSQPTVYGELHFGAAGVRHSDLDFFPLFASVSAGVFLVPNIGIEVFADTALADEDNAGFNMEISSAYGIAARFQSPPRAGLSGYIVVGLVNYTLMQTPVSQTLNNGGIEEDFRGARVSVGIVQQLKRTPTLSVSAEYRSYHADQPIRVDSIVLGLRITP